MRKCVKEKVSVISVIFCTLFFPLPLIWPYVPFIYLLIQYRTSPSWLLFCLYSISCFFFFLIFDLVYLFGMVLVCIVFGSCCIVKTPAHMNHFKSEQRLHVPGAVVVVSQWEEDPPGAGHRLQRRRRRLRTV